MIYSNTLELIRETPLVKLDKLSKSVNLYGKLELVQPGGSVKDRAAYQIIKDAYESGILKKGQLVVEMTSGNMGAGLAVVCKQFGNPFIAVMSEGNSQERIKILKALGADVILTKQVDGKHGKVTGKDIDFASNVAREYAITHNAYYVDQFNNPSGVKAHYESTGPEIWADLPKIDVFITSIGSGGTFMGISKFLKLKNTNIKCIAVEPENASILKTGKVESSQHIIQGTGYGLIPPHWDHEFADDIISVSDSEALEMTKRICHEQGLFVGYSSGANVAAALKYIEMNNEVKNVVTILCDTGFKYSDL
jgi:cysteine synthase